MMQGNDERRLFDLFADLMDYPSEALLSSAREATRYLRGANARAANEIQAFLDFADSVGVEGLEEIYSRTFDITPTTNLYAGYFLFGESYKRGQFLVRLQEEYRKLGFSAGSELPDHLSVVLRFLSLADDPEFADPLLGECILPMLEKMESDFKEAANGYRNVISSLKLFLRQEGRESVAVGGMQNG